MSAYKVGLTYCRLGECGLAACGSTQVFVPASYDNSNEPSGPLTNGDFLKQSTDPSCPRGTVILGKFRLFCTI